MPAVVWGGIRGGLWHVKLANTKSDSRSLPRPPKCGWCPSVQFGVGFRDIATVSDVARYRPDQICDHRKNLVKIYQIPTPPTRVEFGKKFPNFVMQCRALIHGTAKIVESERDAFNLFCMFFVFSCFL